MKVDTGEILGSRPEAVAARLAGQGTSNLYLRLGNLASLKKDLDMFAGNAGVCPVCGRNILPVIVRGRRGVSCIDPLCKFNFADQKCGKCGGEVVRVEHPELGLFRVWCSSGHDWNVSD